MLNLEGYSYRTITNQTTDIATFQNVLFSSSFHQAVPTGTDSVALLLGPEVVMVS